MGRKRLPEDEKKTNSQTAKDYRKRHSDKYKAYERLRQEKRKLERLERKGFRVNNEDVHSSSVNEDIHSSSVNDEDIPSFSVNEEDFHSSSVNEEDIHSSSINNENIHSSLLASKPNIIELDKGNSSLERKIDLSCKIDEPMIRQTFKRSHPELLLDILQNMNSMQELQDIKVVCFDGSFMWSRLLLSRLSPYMNLILKKAEETEALIVDNGIKGKTVHEALINLLQVKPEWKEEYQGVYQLFCVPINSDSSESTSTDFVKAEVVNEENYQDFDLDNEELFQSEELKIEETNVSEQILPLYDCGMVNIEKKVKEKPNKKSFSFTQIEAEVETIQSKIKIIKKNRLKKKKMGRPPVAEKDNMWIRDPSPDRFIDGKKVKYICVTQENIATGPPYHCIACNHKSNILVNLKKHYRIHSNEKPFGCKVCGKKFSSSSAVSTHWNNRHNKNWVKEFSCDICGLLFPQQNKLLRHRVVHSGEAFACQVCGKEFDTPWKKERHEKTHTQESVACPICGKEFSNKRNAENHQERHGDARNYECDICGQKSKTKRDLRIHKNNMHSDDHPECECTECGKVFKRKNLLDQHMRRVHEKSTRFQCLLCPQVLSTKNHFNKHSLRCHDGQMIPVSNRVK